MGGGSIFIRRVFHKRAGYDDIWSEFYEGIGQVSGLSLSVILAWVGVHFESVYLLAALSAVVAAVAAMFVIDERGLPFLGRKVSKELGT